MLNHNLLKNARAGIQKLAFNPMTEEAQAAAAQQGGAPPPGGAPPMDPSMMGGAPPMDPAMMGGGGMPPMDPSMMGMDPSMMGMDPAMMGMDPSMMGGGAPPMDPAMMGGGMPPADPSMGGGGTPVTLNLEDLQQIVQELAKGGGAEGGEGEGESKRVTNRQVMDEITMLKEQLSALAAGMGIQLPAGDVGAGGDTSVSPDMSSPEDLEAAALGDEMMADATGGAPAPGGDALAGDPAFEALNAGLPPGEGMPKLAATSWLASTRLGR